MSSWIAFRNTKVPFACIAIDIIGNLPTTSSSNRYALTCIDLLTSYIIAVPIPNEAAESVVEAYLSGILPRTGASMVCLSGNGSDLKNSQMNTVSTQLGIKHIFSNPYRPQGNSDIENVHNFLKRMLTKFLSSSDAEWDKILPFTCYGFNTIPTADDLESPFPFVHGRDLLEGHTGLLGKSDIRYLGDDKGLILFAEICKLWLAHAKALQENRQLKTDKVKKNKHFKAHNFKVGQPIAVKNHLRNTFESKFIADYTVLEIVNDHTLIVESPDGKTRWININDAKLISVRAVNNNALQDFKLPAMKKEHTHQYQLWSSAK